MTTRLFKNMNAGIWPEPAEAWAPYQESVSLPGWLTLSRCKQKHLLASTNQPAATPGFCTWTALALIGILRWQTWVMGSTPRPTRSRLGPPHNLSLSTLSSIITVNSTESIGTLECTGLVLRNPQGQYLVRISIMARALRLVLVQTPLALALPAI